MACKIVTSEIARLQVLADLLDGIPAKGLAFFVDVDLHGLVNSSLSKKDHTNLNNRASIVQGF